MKSSTVLRSAYGSACVVLLAAMLAGSAQAAPRRKPPVKAKPVAEAPVVPPASTGAPSILSRRAIETAIAYRSYMDKAAKITSAFKTGAQIEESLMTGAGFEPQQLSQGVIAYAAVVALQDASYVAGVRASAHSDDERRELVRRIVENPNVATTLPGSNSAAGAISATLGADGSKVAGAGALVKQAAYDIQKSAWSKAAIPGAPARLARAKQLSLTAMRASPAEVAALAAAVSAADARAAAPPTSTDAMAAPTTQTVSRGLAIAALAALGAGGDDNEAVVLGLLNDPGAGFCMSMSKLNLNQCLSVSKPYYEDVFCLGQHILIDTGQCVSKGAGQSAVPVASTFAAGASAEPRREAELEGRTTAR